MVGLVQEYVVVNLLHPKSNRLLPTLRNSHQILLRPLESSADEGQHGVRVILLRSSRHPREIPFQPDGLIGVAR